MNREGFGRVDSETHGFALRVEGIEVDMCDYTERGLWAVRFELVELAVREA